MGIKLKNMDKAPAQAFETVSVLGLEIPKTDKLPFGATVEYMDLTSARDRRAIGDAEFYFRLFCLFTWRLPRDQRVSYEWLADQNLQSEEVEAITRATRELLEAYADGQKADGGEKKSSRKAKTTN